MSDKQPLVLLYVNSAGVYNEVLAQGDQYGNLSTVDVLHKRVHEGRIFSLKEINSAAASSKYNYIFATSSQELHYRLSALDAEGAPFSIELYEGPTVVLAGTAKNPVNHDRSSSRTLPCSITYGGSVSAVGSLISGSMVTGTFQSGGSIDERDHEYKLKPNMTYLVQVSNLAAQANRFSLRQMWYEPAIHLD